MNRPIAGARQRGRQASWVNCDDDGLLRRARGGDDAAFGELYSRHCGAARRYAARALRGHGGSDRADDIVAEAFGRVLRLMRGGKGPVDGFRPYLFTCIRHAVTTEWRKSQHQFSAPAGDAEPGGDPGDRLEGMLAMDALRSLNPRFQRVLWATSVHGLTPTELALMTGMRANTVAAVAARARAALRRAYEAQA